MCKGISILKARLKQELFDEYELAKRIVARGADDSVSEQQPELHFMFTDAVVMLPVEFEGQTHIMEWGNRGGKIPKLPKTGWCRQESFDAGKWKWLHPEPCIIPANFGLEKGVWFHIEEGICGIVVRDQQKRPHVYMLTQQASVYYENMTRHERIASAGGSGDLTNFAGATAGLSNFTGSVGMKFDRSPSRIVA